MDETGPVTAVRLDELVGDLARLPQPRAEALANRLTDLVLDASLRAGQRLGTKAELAARFGVAAGTLNEALRILQARELVELKPGPRGGVFVADAPATLRLRNALVRVDGSADTVEQALVVRTALDRLVAVEAARHADARDAADLEALLAELWCRRGTPTEFVLANWALHERMAQATGNAVLARIYVGLLDVARQALDGLVIGDAYAERVQTTYDIHAALVAAVVAGDEAAAAAAADDHEPNVYAVRAQMSPRP